MEEVRKQRAVAQAMMASFRPCPPQDWIKRFEQHVAHQGDSLTDQQRWDADPCVFWQGSPNGVGNDTERPRHRVRLRPFAMQATTVTRAQYRLFDPHFESSREKSSRGGVIAEQLQSYSGDGKVAKRDVLADDCPILMVDWFDAVMFAKFLGAGFRLPTEAEWEFACRADRDGPEDLFHFGRELSHDQANFAYEVKRTTPAGFYPVNAFQLDQMHGNVWEWCADWFDRSYYEDVTSKTPVNHPHGPHAGSSRVLRGGAFVFSGIGVCRSASRLDSVPGYRRGSIGFRVVGLSVVWRPSPSS